MIALREEARLRAMFERLLLLSLATSPLACSSASDNVGRADAGAPSPAPPSADAGEADAGEPAETALDASPASDAGKATGTGNPPTADPYGFSDAACDPVPLDGGADDSGCDYRESLPCGLPPGTPTENCYIALVNCSVLCHQPESLQRTCAIAECLNVDASTIPSTTPLTLECATAAPGCGLGVGRRPEGLVAAAPAKFIDAVGAVLADTARLEAASVHAFRRLGSELASMRAPRSLVHAAERSARDEVRHARVMGRLARRHGAVPSPVSVSRARHSRSLESFAIENAVEGCVRECFGALVAQRQAFCARDPELAKAMGPIARDETRHAALAWTIARWIAPRLSHAARVRTRRAMRAALAGLRREVESTPADLALLLGVPAGAEGAALVDAFQAALFSASAPRSARRRARQGQPRPR